MNRRKRLSLPGRVGFPAAACLAALLAGCLAVPDVDSAADPLVVTEAGAAAPISEAATGRAAAVAEMRAEGLAGEALPYPDAYQAAQTTRLAAREEPRSVQDVAAIESELAAIADRRARTANAAEIAELEARARELRRLAAAQAQGAAQ